MKKRSTAGKLTAWLLLIAFALSPVYLWQSGLPQMHHIIAAVAMGIYLLWRRKVWWMSWWKFGLGFALYTIIVNLVVFALHTDLFTLLSSIYYIFGFLIFVLLTSVTKEVGRPLLAKVFWIHVVLLAIITALSLAGAGRLFAEGRMMGVFNNPNQMGNWVLWTAIIVGVTGRAIYGSWLPGILTIGLSMLAIIFTASRSATLGLIVLLWVYALMGLYNLILSLSLRVRISLGRAVISLLVIIIAMSSFAVALASDQQVQLSNLLSQVEFLMARLIYERNPDDTLEGRGYDRLWKFPEYLILGAGEGANYRYSEHTWFLGEIHSSWAGLLFNYGLIGSLLFFGFIYHLLQRIGLVWFKLMLLAIFVYGLATYGLRNWYFWIGLSVVYVSWELIRVQGRYPGKPISP